MTPEHNSAGLPESYKPLEKLVFCSNELLRVSVPILIDDFKPILIGKGSPYNVWLWKRLTTGNALPLVSSNTVVYNEIRRDSQGSTTEFFLKGERLLRIEVRDAVEVTLLDLRPLGMSIWGDEQGLNVGESRLEKNRFAGLGAMLAITSLAEERPQSVELARMRELAGHHFEEAVAQALERQGHRVERLGGRPRDEGVDLLVTTEDGLWAIECKQQPHPISVRTIDILLNAKARLGADYAALITSGKISPSAIRNARTADIMLIDGDSLLALLEGKDVLSDVKL